MSIEINRQNAGNQLLAMTANYQTAVTSIQAIKTAIQAFIDSPDLQSQAYNSLRAHYIDYHFPILNGMLSFIDETLAANSSYQNQMCTLKGNYLNETALRNQLEEIWSLRYNIFQIVPFYQTLLNLIEKTVQDKLDSLILFQQNTQGLYITAQALLENVKTGISLIEAATYNPTTHTFSFPPGLNLDMTWQETLNAVWDDKQANGMKALEFQGDQAYIKGFDPTVTCYSADPVNLSTGNFIYQKEDLHIPGVIPLTLTRFYNALDRHSGALGSGWVHNYEQRLELQDKKLVFHKADGREETFIKVADNLFINGHTGITKITFNMATNHYHHRENDKHTYFDQTGRMIIYQDQNGNQATFSYGQDAESRQLKQVQSNNAYIALTYNNEDRLASAVDHTGRKITYHYKDGCLVQVVQPGDQTIAYNYDQNGYLNKITNPRGIESLHNTFDSSGRTTQQTFPDGGTMNYRYEDAARKVILTERNTHQTTYYHDEQFRTIKIEDEVGTEHFAYNTQNQRTKATDRLGRITSFEYDKRGNMTKVIDPLSNQFEQTYTQNNKLLSLRINKDLKIKNKYDAKGNLTQTEDALRRSLRFQYNAQGNPTTVVQPDGSTLHFAYDERGNPTAITDAAGHTTHYEYDLLNRAVKTIDPKGASTSYVYDNQNNIIRVINAQGQERCYTYNKSNKIESIVDFDDSTISIEYNSLNKPSKHIDAMGNVTHYEYDPMWNLSKQTDPNGAETRYTYTPHNQLESVTDPMGATIRYEYDAVGNRIKIIDSQGYQTKITYNALNFPIAVTEPDGAVTQYTRDLEGRITQIIDPMGNETKYIYDTAGQKIQEVNALGHITQFTYTPLGQVETVTDTKGGIHRNEYYPGGKLRRTILPEGESKTYEYDENSNVSKITDALGNTTELAYDAQDRITQIKNPLGHIKSFKYDAVGNITEVMNENNHMTQYKYSPLGNIVEVIDPMGHTIRYEYDTTNRLSKIEQYRIIDDTLGHIQELQNNLAVPTDCVLSAETQTTTFERNKNGAITAIHAPMGKTTRYEYDTAGNIITKTGEDDRQTHYEYTSADQLSKIAYADGKTVEYSYNPLKQLIQMKDWLGITTLAPDALGRTEKITDFEGKTVQYLWDELSRKSKIIYPSTDSNTQADPVFEVCYTYNRSGRMTGVITPQGETHYQYNIMGQLIQTERPNLITQYDYNPTGMLNRLTHAKKTAFSSEEPAGAEILDQFMYTYDPASQITQIDKCRQSIPEDNGIFRYTYDPAGRLTNASRDGKQKEYIYDSLGNRIVSHEPDHIGHSTHATFHTYNALNQLISTRDQDSLEEYHYDQRGNLAEVLRDGVVKARYTFDGTNMMTQAITDKGQGQYTYDGFMHRVKRLEQFADTAQLMDQELRVNVPMRETRFVFDMALPYNNLLQTQTISKIQNDETANIQSQSFIWGNTLLSSDGQEEFHYLTDHLGSPIRLVGVEEDPYHVPLVYDEFGVPLVDATGKATGNPFGFTGYQPDDISGFHYAQARYYDPITARFVSEDLARDGINYYAHCYNDPINFVDFDGYEPVFIGYVYIAEGINPETGNPAVYIGQTGQELQTRFTGHKWQEFITADTTTTTRIKVMGELDASISKRGTLISARKEALGVAEQDIIIQYRDAKKTLLNKDPAASKKHLEPWRKAYNVSYGEPEKVTIDPAGGIRGGIKVTGIGALMFIDAATLSREYKMSPYIQHQAVFEDEKGTFTVGVKYGVLNLFGNHYLKTYEDGTEEEISKEDYKYWKAEAHALWGYFDFWGNFVPGLLQPELPNISCDTA